jgi:hypothetical protein
VGSGPRRRSSSSAGSMDPGRNTTINLALVKRTPPPTPPARCLRPRCAQNDADGRRLAPPAGGVKRSDVEALALSLRLLRRSPAGDRRGTSKTVSFRPCARLSSNRCSLPRTPHPAPDNADASRRTRAWRGPVRRLRYIAGLRSPPRLRLSSRPARGPCRPTRLA